LLIVNFDDQLIILCNKKTKEKEKEKEKQVKKKKGKACCHHLFCNKTFEEGG
jgi:hypothetical protein